MISNKPGYERYAHANSSNEYTSRPYDCDQREQLSGKDELPAIISAAGLSELGKIDTRLQHARAADASDPLHAARKAETTSLWRLTGC